MESAIIQVGAIGLFLLAGLVWPRQKDGIFIPDTWINLATGAVLFGFRVVAIRPVEALVGQGLVSVAAWPVALQVLVTFLALDFLRYWLHRFHHRVPFLWQFHRVHHSTEHMNATAGLRMHVVDLIQLTALPLLIFHLIFDYASFAPGVVVGVLLIGAVMDAFIHANLPFDITRPLPRLWNRLLNNPHFHAWHHTRDGDLRDGNYSNTLIIWDRLFGSDVTSDVLPEAYGVPDDQMVENSTLGLQLLRPPRRDSEAAATAK